MRQRGEAQREGQNCGEGGDQEGGSLVSQLTTVPPESPLLYGEAQASGAKKRPVFVPRRRSAFSTK